MRVKRELPRRVYSLEGQREGKEVEAARGLTELLKAEPEAQGLSLRVIVQPLDLAGSLRQQLLLGRLLWLWLLVSLSQIKLKS